MTRHWPVAAVVTVFLGLAVFHIDFLAGFVGDERTYKNAAWEIVSGGPRTNLEHPLLSKTIQGFAAVVCSVTGSDPVVGMRLMSVVAAAVALAATFALARIFLPSPAALLSAVLLSVNTLFLVHGRLISPEMVSVAFLAVSLYFFISERIVKRPSALDCSAAFFGFSLAAKWVGVWLAPWMLARLILGGARWKTARWIAVVFLFYAIGNAAYFLNHTPAQAIEWHRWIFSYHQTSAAISAYNGSPAWSWFLVPQHLYYARLAPSAEQSTLVMSTMNLVVFLLAVPSLIFAFSKSAPPAARLIAECVLCLYIPWLFVSRPTYFFYVLTLLPFLAVLEASLLHYLWERGKTLRAISCAAAVAAAILFFFFYPAAVGIQISAGYEKSLAAFNFYSRPIHDSMFCQRCNLYFASVP